MAIVTFIVIAAALIYYVVHTGREREQERQRERQRLEAFQYREALRREQAQRDDIQRDRRVFQAADTRQSTVVQIPRHDQLNDNRSFLPPPHLVEPLLLTYLRRNARDQCEKQKGAKLRDCWKIIINGLTATNLGTAAQCSHNLDVPTLKYCYGLPDNTIIKILIRP